MTEGITYYPITQRIIKLLRTKYDNHVSEKGDSWKNYNMLSFLKGKLVEEQSEVIESLYNEHTVEETKSELLDEILVACMLYEVLCIE